LVILNAKFYSFFNVGKECHCHFHGRGLSSLPESEMVRMGRWTILPKMSCWVNLTEFIPLL
jgi:hypothetical protein